MGNLDTPRGSPGETSGLCYRIEHCDSLTKQERLALTQLLRVAASVQVGQLTWAVEQLLLLIDGELTPSARRYVVTRARELIGQEAGR